jgi:hypothetical protein
MLCRFLRCPLKLRSYSTNNIWVLALLLSLSSDSLCCSCFDFHSFGFLAAMACPFFRLALVANSQFLRGCQSSPACLISHLNCISLSARVFTSVPTQLRYVTECSLHVLQGKTNRALLCFLTNYWITTKQYAHHSTWGVYLPSGTAEIQNRNSHTIINSRPLKILKKKFKSKRIQTVFDLGWPSGCDCHDKLGPKELLRATE